MKQKCEYRDCNKRAVRKFAGLMHYCLFHYVLVKSEFSGKTRTLTEEEQKELKRKYNVVEERHTLEELRKIESE